MKNYLLKFAILTSLALITFGCCDDCNYVSFSIDSTFKTSDNHNICNTKQALIGNKSYYDTRSGEATLYIPVPKGHSLKKVSQTKSSVQFITSGVDFTKEYDVYIVNIEGLEEKDKTILTVEVEITFTGKDLCDISSRSEKKKKSEVTGVPPAK